MKIAIIHNQYKLRGGTESYLFDLINGFLVQGDEVEVVVFKQDTSLVIPNTYTVKKIKLPPVFRFMQPFVFARQLKKNFDPNAYDLTLSITRTASQHISICGGTHKSFLAKTNKTKKLPDLLEIYLEKQCFNSSRKIIAHSRLIQQEIIDLYQVNPDKVELLYPPISISQFNIGLKLKKNEYRGKFGLAKQKFSLLFPSTGHKRKGLFVLLEAFKLLPKEQFELIIAGNKLAMQVEENIKFAGFVKNMPELYAAVDGMVLPAFYEPFGLVVIEAIQCGTPVIISPFVGAKDFVTSEQGIILDKITPECIANSIQQLARTHYQMSDNFIGQHNLGINEHINAIKNIWLRNEV